MSETPPDGPPPSIASLRSRFEQLSNAVSDRQPVASAVARSRSPQPTSTASAGPSASSPVVPASLRSKSPRPSLSVDTADDRARHPPPIPAKPAPSQDATEAAPQGVDKQAVLSVKALKSKFGGGGGVEPGGANGGGPVAESSAMGAKRKAPPPVQAKPASLTATGARKAEGVSREGRSDSAPSIRRTSVDGHEEPITSPPAVQTTADPLATFTKEVTTSPSISPAYTPSASPAPSTAPTSRAPSPKPPEPDRSTKPAGRTGPGGASQHGPSGTTDGSESTPATKPIPIAPPSRNAPPSLPARKGSSPTSTSAPPTLPSRPKLASVASAIIAAKVISSTPPQLPARPRGESVGTSASLPPPPTRNTLPPPTLARPLPSKSLSPGLLASYPTERSDSAPPPARARGLTLSVPDGEYHPPPPPSRTAAAAAQPPPRRQNTRSAPPAGDADSEEEDEAEDGAAGGPTSAAKRAMEDYPDSTNANRRPPKFSPDIRIAGTAHLTAFAIHGRYVCTGSHAVRVYDTLMSEQPLFCIQLHETGLELRLKESKVTAMCFRPALYAAEDGRYLWCGTKDGHLWELDIRTGNITDTRAFAHASAVVQIFRYKQWILSLEEGGKLHVFEVGKKVDGQPDDAAKIPQLCRTVRVTEKFNFAKLIGGRLWVSSGPASRSTTSSASKGPTLRVYDPCTPGTMPTGKTVWTTEWTGAVTCATILPLNPSVLYVGHEGGYVSVWDADEVVCQQVLKISASDILAMEGVGERLWAGNRKGQIYVFDVSCRPWRTTNMWIAHPEHALQQLMIDPWSIEQTGRFVLWSLAKDALRAWDGMLSVDWIDQQMVTRQQEYCNFREIKALVCSWNIDSARSAELAGSDVNTHFLSDLLGSVNDPTLIVFGFQEVIPLTDKKLTAKTILFGGKNKEAGVTADKVSHAYRQWTDRLTMAVRSAYPNTNYIKIHSESLVGLFSCVFVKQSERELLTDVDVTTVKRGIGGIYGNKGAIVARLVMDDTSICFINVHLAAGQSAKVARTADLGAIMEDKAILPVTGSIPFVNGGDGTAILDHELVILNGDLNYRIDQRRENVLSLIEAKELAYLLEHDQLRKEMRTNHAFRLRSFEEAPITFEPTYKYNTGTSDYDSSEKRRIPAWCDRILYNKSPRLECLHYRRYEPTISDHKPISAGFAMQIKAIDPLRRDKVRKDVGQQWVKREAELLEMIEQAYKALI